MGNLTKFNAEFKGVKYDIVPFRSCTECQIDKTICELRASKCPMHISEMLKRKDTEQ